MRKNLGQKVKKETAKLAQEMEFLVEGLIYESERIGFLKWKSYQIPLNQCYNRG